MSLAWRHTKLGIVCSTFALCTTAFFIRPLPPRRAPAPKPQELYEVVMQELSAIRVSDYQGAYRHASLSMQERFNLGDFADLVRADRPGIGRFERVEFGAVAVQGRHVFMPAYFFLPGGSIAVVHYTLVREEGAWKIDSARLDRRWDRGHRVGGERT